MTDQEIIRGFLAGSGREYAEVLGWINAVVRSRLWAERVAPEDVVADTRLKLLQIFRDDAFRLESSLKTHVQRITLYTLVDAVRQQKRLVPLPAAIAKADTGDPLSSLEQEEDLAMLERAIAILPEGCQELFRMSLFEKLKCREIASRKGTTEGAVKTRLSRCRERLAEIMRHMR